MGWGTMGGGEYQGVPGSPQPLRVPSSPGSGLGAARYFLAPVFFFLALSPTINDR